MKAVILTFHRVNPQRDPLWDPIDPLLFRRILAFISRRYSVLSLQELVAGNVKTKKRPLAITFDDGYRDYIQYALPVLHEFDFHSSMYIVTDCVEKGMPTWTYILDYLFSATEKLSLPAADYGEQCRSFEIFQWANKQEQLRYAKTFKQHLKKVNEADRDRIIKHFSQHFNDIALPGNLIMSWDDLRALKSEKVEIGSHTVSHPPLATVTDEAQLKHEIYGSGMIIKEKLGFFPDTISYPVGSYNEKVKSVAAASGYKSGLAVNHILYDPAKQGLFEIPRIELYNDSFFRNKLRVTGVEAFVKSVLR